MIYALLFIASMGVAMVAIGLYGISKALSQIDARLTQFHLEHVNECRSHTDDLQRIEDLFRKPSPPSPTYRATPRYDFESTQVAALDDFKEKA